ncbi:MAG TPA: hypothetical protein VL357_06920 [Rariglobus sp.]|jgi:hypothetical protein|nr:hypothetical protein [Rariglobus sp.]
MKTKLVSLHAYIYPCNFKQPQNPSYPAEVTPWVDTIKTAALKRDGNYVISYSFGKVLGRLQQRLKQQADYVDSKASVSDRPLLTEDQLAATRDGLKRPALPAMETRPRIRRCFLNEMQRAWLAAEAGVVGVFVGGMARGEYPPENIR